MSVSHLPILTLLTAASTLAAVVNCQQMQLPNSAAEELRTFIKMEEEVESVELCSSSADTHSTAVIHRKDGSEITVKKPKIALVNYTESILAENYCCSTGTSVRCTFKYKPFYYFLCIFSGVALTLIVVVGIIALVYKCRKPWNIFSNIAQGPLMNRTTLSIRSDPLTSDQVADSSVDDFQQQPKLHQAPVKQRDDDRLLPELF